MDLHFHEAYRLVGNAVLQMPKGATTVLSNKVLL